MNKKSIIYYLALFCFFSFSSSAYSQNNSQYDLVIRNGRILDGSGNPWIYGDIAINNGRFEKIGLIDGGGKKEIDAAGRYISPGWIDMMDQSGGVILKNGKAENKLHMGVTTIISGEAGTPVPAEGIPQYFSDLETQGISLNFGTYYGATQARTAVIGDGDTNPTPKQLKEMEKHVEVAMKAGAFGIATALIYPPSSFHTTEDLIALSIVVAKYDGIFAVHMRNEGEFLIDAVGETIEIGEKSGAAVEIFHLKSSYYKGWGENMKKVGVMVDEARKRGVDIAADVYPYTAGGTGFEITAPGWVWRDGFDKAVERLNDHELRKQLKKEVRAGSQEGWSNLVYDAGGWNQVVLANAFNEKYEKYHFKTISEIAKDLNLDPEDVAWNIMLEALPNRAVALYFMMSEEDIEHALKFPWVSIGSDASASEELGMADDLGLPHPRSYGTFPRIISEYVKKRKILSLEEAIRKMTSWPATRMGIHDRGTIQTGMWADVVVFDLETIKDNADWENPMLTPSGIDYVIVNGELVIEQGKYTNKLPGQVLKGNGFNK